MKKNTQEWIQDGLAYTEDGNLSDALTCFQRALEIDAFPLPMVGSKRMPTSAENWYYLGLVLARPKRRVEASAVLDQARKYAGDSPELWKNIGEVYFMLGKPTQAVAAFDTARQKAPGYDPACYGKARSHLMLGQKAHAQEAGREYLAAAQANDSLVPTVRKMLAICD